MKEKILLVNSLRRFDDNIYWCTKNGDLFENGIQILENVECQSFWVKCNFVYFHGLDGDFFLYDTTTKIRTKVAYNIDLMSLEDDKAFCSFDFQFIENNWYWKNGLLDLNKRAFLKEYENAENKNFAWNSKHKYVLTKERQLLYGLDKESGLLTWFMNLGDIVTWFHTIDNKWEFGEVLHFVGIVDEVLWVDIQGHHLIGLDITTGKLKHDLTKPDKIIGLPTKSEHEALPVYFSTFYDEKNKVLFGLAYDVYIEVDLKQEKPYMTFYVLEEECNRLQVHHAYRNQRCCFDENHFYFVDVMTGKIAALNRGTKIFDWIYTFPEASTTGVLTDIQVSDKNLYVLDAGGTLHVFEKE